MSHLVTHPWDGLGQPPVPGRDYIVSELAHQVLDVAKALAEAQELEEEADYLDDDASEKRREADKKRDEVKAVLEAIRKGNPKLASAIEDAPHDYDSPDAARKAAA